MFQKIKLYAKYFKKFFLGSSHFLIKIDNSNFYIRPKSYDIEVLGEIYFEKLYEPTFPVSFRMNTIVDLGAYIGDFSVWAFKKYKPEKLVLVEPSTDNALLLIENTKFNGMDGKSIIVQKAIYNSEKKEVGINEKTVNKGMNRVTENTSSMMVKTITFKELLEQNKIDIVDYLKIDIEGAEKYIFIDEYRDLIKNRVRYINMETHHHIGNQPKKNLEYLKSLGFRVKYKWVWHNLADMIEAVNTNI